MPERHTRNSLRNDLAQKDHQHCAEELDELKRFLNADQKPIQASEDFKEKLREKLWRFLEER